MDPSLFNMPLKLCVRNDFNGIEYSEDIKYSENIKYVGAFYGLTGGIVIDFLALLPFMASVACRAMRGNRCLLPDGDMLSGSIV